MTNHSHISYLPKLKDDTLVYECLVDSDGLWCVLLYSLHVFNPFCSTRVSKMCGGIILSWGYLNNKYMTDALYPVN